MPYVETLNYEYPLWQEEGRSEAPQLEKMISGSLVNPYPNYLALLRHLKSLATDAPLEQLTAFADCGQMALRAPGSAWSRYSLLLFQWTEGPEKPGWYDFEDSDFSKLLNEDDFLAPCFDGQAYRNLDYYLAAQVELRVLRDLPDNANQIQALWLEENLLDFYWQTWPLHKVIHQALEIQGWQWFCAGAEHNPLHYRGSLLALLTRQEYQPEAQQQTHRELIALHDQLILSAGHTLTKPVVAELRQSIQSSIEDLAPDPND